MSLPLPSPADLAVATAFIDGDYAKTRGLNWRELHRDKAIHQAAMLEMGRRTDAEFRGGGR